MKKLLPLAAVLAAGCASPETDHDYADREDGREISQLVVPDRVLAAARAKVPGFVLTEADLIQRNNTTVYALEGNVRGEDYDIIATTDGRILRVDN
jgi:uncharacterized membrane protein YkoI